MKFKIDFKYETDDGWTFIETIMVIAIVLILTSSVGFTAFRYIDKARGVTARGEIENFSLALSVYYLDCLAYPPQEVGLASLWENSGETDGWDGPYVTKKPHKDPWGNDYEYKVPGIGGLPFSLCSFGSDGIEGGEGDCRDIRSWE